MLNTYRDVSLKYKSKEKEIGRGNFPLHHQVYILTKGLYSGKALIYLRAVPAESGLPAAAHETVIPEAPGTAKAPRWGAL